MKKSLYLLIISIFFVSTVFAQHPQLENSSFEEWEQLNIGTGIFEPVEWSTIKSSDNSQVNTSAPVTVIKSTDAHSGDYSVKLITKSVFEIPVPGTVTNGRFHATFNPDEGYVFTDPDNDMWNTVVNAKPDSLTGWYKVKSVNGDKAKVKIVMHTDFVKVSETQDTTGFIGSGTLFLSGNDTTNWKKFSLPINYYTNDIPKYVLVIISSSYGVNAVVGSELWIDDLKLVYNNSGIAEENAKNMTLFAKNNSLNVFISGKNKDKFKLEIYDISGKKQLTGFGYLNEKNSFDYNLPKGIYIVSVKYGNNLLTKKIEL